MGSASLSHDGQVVAELADRWARARLAAFGACAAEGARAATELDWAAHALATSASAAEKAVFDNSLALGRSFRRHYGVALTLADLPRVLPQLRTPCCDGVFKAANAEAGLFLLRQGCVARSIGPGACGVYREAIHGLVLGLTDGLHHARHSSAGAGDEACVDVIFPEGSALRYGPIPADVQAALDAAVRQLRAFDSAVSVKPLGINEGTLHYRFARGLDTQVNAQTRFERTLQKRFPKLRFHEASPRPVFAGE